MAELKLEGREERWFQLVSVEGAFSNVQIVYSKICCYLSRSICTVTDILPIKK